MIQKLIKTIENHKMLNAGEHVVIGLSGGADSVALLYGLRELDMNIVLSAVHVNHGVRGIEADSDENFVIELCRDLEIPLKVYHCEIYKEAKRLKVTIEEAGRIIRYQAFAETCKNFKADKIAVAHNMNDNAETVFMRLCRGTGLKGLCGIPAKRDNIIRPMIEISRKEIEEYCIGRNLGYCIDSTNLETLYTRNKIRLELIPFLENNFNQEIILGISKMTELINEENELIEELTAKALEQCLAFGNENELALYINLLQSHPTAIKRRVVKKAYSKFSNNMSQIHIESILSLLNKESGKTINLPHHVYAKKEYELLLIHKKSLKKEEFYYKIPLEEEVFIFELNISVIASLKKPVKNSNNSYTKIFCYDKMKGVMQVRSRLPGDKIFVKSMGGTKKIKDYFSDIKLPQRRREQVPLLAFGSDIVWIMDEKSIVSDLYKCNCDRETKLFITWNKIEN